MNATKTNPCAVIACPNDGRPQICNADGKYHHHGRTHYDRGLRPPTMQTRPIEEGWFLMCDKHNEEIKTYLAAVKK